MATNQTKFKTRYGVETDAPSKFGNEVVLKDKLSQNISTPLAVSTIVNLTTATGNYVPIQGLGTIESFGTTVNPGESFRLVFDSTVTIQNSADILCPANTDMIFNEGDWCVVVAVSATVWKVEDSFRADGTNYADNSLAYAIALG